MSDRRSFPRIPGSALPGLTAFTARCSTVRLLDISSGGALIEAPTRLKPGERELFVLQGQQEAVRVVGWIVRAEITGLSPRISYRSGVRFAAPVTLSSLGCSAPLVPSSRAHELPRRTTETRALPNASRELREEVTRVLRSLASVRAVRVASSLLPQPGLESIHFAVPKSSYGDRRLLQVFLVPGSVPTPEEFTQLRHLAALASALQDIDHLSVEHRRTGAIDGAT